jgi:hypothetical protein
MRTCDLRGRKPHGINGLAGVVETRRQKTLLCILAEQWIPPERIMHGNVHDVPRIKTEPANRAGQITIGVWGCNNRIALGLVGEAGRWSYRFRMRHCEFYAAMRAINPAPGVFFFRLQLLTA